MVLLFLFACPMPGDPLDPGSPWNGGQTGSESASCDDEESSPIDLSEDESFPVEGEYALTFVWEEDWREDPLTLTVTPTSDLLGITSEECGDREQFEAEVSFVLESGDYDLIFPAIVTRAEGETSVFEFWAETDDVTLYAAFPDSGPTGTLTGDTLIGRF